MLHFDPTSFRIFDPVGAQAMRQVWPTFRAFGHAKQRLNPARYPAFIKRLKNIAVPARLKAR
jgi:hypothetical protein